MEGRFVAYYRVSTDRQGQSGLGLEAQRAAVMSYLNGGDWKLVAEFTEVESGKHSDRAQLRAAQAACKKQGNAGHRQARPASRNVHFLSGLMEAGTKFVAVDNPNANKLTIHILAAVAEDERERISARTKAALAAAKARGKRLGNPRLAQVCADMNSARKEAANAFAASVLPTIREIQKSGVTSLRGIARALSAKGLRTTRGAEWTAVQVAAVLRR